jgi:hypothetical protein
LIFFGVYITSENLKARNLIIFGESRFFDNLSGFIQKYIKAAEPTLSNQLESITAIVEILEFTHSKLIDKCHSNYKCGGMPEAISRLID